MTDACDGAHAQGYVTRTHDPTITHLRMPHLLT